MLGDAFLLSNFKAAITLVSCGGEEYSLRGSDGRGCMQWYAIPLERSAAIQVSGVRWVASLRSQ